MKGFNWTSNTRLLVCIIGALLFTLWVAFVATLLERVEARAEGEEMSDAETSAYLLMAAGLIWVLVGIVGLVRLSRRRRQNDLRTGQHRS